MKPHTKVSKDKNKKSSSKYCINPSGKILNNKISLEDVKRILYLTYGNCVELHSLNEKGIYKLEERYTFYRNELLYKHTKEFTIPLKDIIYRNFYWINSPYKMSEIYDNIKKDIKKGNFVKNEKYYIELNMDDGYDIKFYPDYINIETKSFLHYFDMSWFYCPDLNSKREITKKIFEFFENNEEWSLEYYFEARFERDFD